jgi:endonuclease-8
MPEGDTVWRSCRRLHEVLAGRTLTRGELRVPALATTDLTGVGVREVVPRGKHQLFRLGNDHTLHTHLRMEGTWRIYPLGRRWSGGPDFQIRAVLSTSEHDCVGYRLPVVEMLPTAEEHEVVGHLGPDLLGPDWDLDEAIRRVTAEPDRTIGEALLDQRNLAGIGTF